MFAIGHGCKIKHEVLSSLTERKSQLADAKQMLDEEYLNEIWDEYWKAARVKKFKSPVIHI